MTATAIGPSQGKPLKFELMPAAVVRAVVAIFTVKGTAAEPLTLNGLVLME
jgi:hypothetical protein